MEGCFGLRQRRKKKGFEQVSEEYKKDERIINIFL
jgi:hypothetical protein